MIPFRHCKLWPRQNVTTSYVLCPAIKPRMSDLLQDSLTSSNINSKNPLRCCKRKSQERPLLAKSFSQGSGSCTQYAASRPGLSQIPTGLTSAKKIDKLLPGWDQTERCQQAIYCNVTSSVDTIRQWRHQDSNRNPWCFGLSHAQDMSRVLAAFARMRYRDRDMMFRIAESTPAILGQFAAADITQLCQISQGECCCYLLFMCFCVFEERWSYSRSSLWQLPGTTWRPLHVWTWNIAWFSI